jgi:competence protein ComGC
MKFCTQCGQAANDDHKFCTKCGSALGNDVSESSSASVVFTQGPPPPRKSDNKVIWLVLAAITLVILMPVLIIIGVAYPALQRARSAANESAAVRTVHMLNGALSIYDQKYGHYPTALEQLTEMPHVRPDSTHAGIIAGQFAHPRQRGYSFSYVATRSSDAADLDHYELRADPVEPGKSGVHHFYSDESGVIRWAEESASATSPKISY